MAAENIIRTNPEARLTLAGGTVSLKANFSGKFLYGFIANAATTITALTGYDQNGEVKDWLAELGCGSMVQNEQYVLPDHCYITAGTIVGALTGYKIKD